MPGRLLFSVACIVLLAKVSAQPGNGAPPGDGPPPDGGGGGGGMGNFPSYVSGTGSSASTACTGGDGSCTTSYVDRQLTYNANTGQMSGTITTNLCPSHTTPMAANVDCVSQTFPDPAFPSSSSPQAAPLLGRVGLTLKEGNNLYGPLDAGFTDGQICDGGTCDGGSDLTVCENQLIYQCGVANVNFDMLMDDCGGHANPYHHHTDLACDYSATNTTAHSPAIGVMLDGYVLYGKWEGSGAAPELDACNGHTGPVPADSTYGITTGDVYHYHSTDAPPYLLGCYGPVDSLAACKALYPDTCDDSEELTTFLGLDGTVISYNLWCPCYQHAGVVAVVNATLLDDDDNSVPLQNTTMDNNTETPTVPSSGSSLRLFAWWLAASGGVLAHVMFMSA